MSRLYVAIDPGLSGAVAAITAESSLVSLQDTPTLIVRKGKKNRNTYVESAMAALLIALTPSDKNILVTIESVHSMPAQGVVSVGTFMMGFGIWLGICAALRLPIQRVEPAVWKRAMGLAAGSDKNASIILASRLFPSASLERKKDHGRAESLLLAEFARRASRTPPKS